MFDFFDNLCGCFSPEIKRNIIEYLSSANLNRNLMEQQKTNQDVSAPKESIYSQVKTKSYYFMKLQQDQKEQRQGKLEIQSPEDFKKEEGEDADEVNWYPSVMGVEGVDQAYKNKLGILRKILKEQIGPEYSKVYDSQDEIRLKIFCKPEIYQNKRFNSYRFTFRIPQKEQYIKTTDYLQLQIPSDNIALHEPLLSGKQKIDVSEGGVEVLHKKYKKVLVINQHEFYLAEKTQVVEQEQKDVVYHTSFSVKGQWNKLPDYSRGWLNLSGLRIAQKTQTNQPSTSLAEEQEQTFIQIDGYLNCQLQISVNANMLKQPIAKQLRNYVQKLICSMTKSDAI